MFIKTQEHVRQILNTKNMAKIKKITQRKENADKIMTAEKRVTQSKYTARLNKSAYEYHEAISIPYPMDNIET